ncbi:MAG: four-carbon acid sugar kinase family protein [Pseudomonadota bacterium]|nr:four-carbon acid sugar kinase family protein [Pseudomonadota bacterium]
MILGVVADDFTGGTDVASMVVRSGLRTVQVIGVPKDAAVPDADAIVVALKSRTAPAAEAVRDSLAAWRWLHAAGARQWYFKYCSTFDSTPQGNIGPLAEALLAELKAELKADFTIACPSLPVNGRTVYRGHLFVFDQLLNESSMRQHPLTPMTDANVVRVLQAQVQSGVGLVNDDVVRAGAAAIGKRFAELRQEGVRFAICDTTATEQLDALAKACAELPLVTAGSGLALGLPEAYTRCGWVTLDAQTASALPAIGDRAAVLAGSSSAATNGQVRRWVDAARPAFRIEPQKLAAGEPVAQQALDWAADQDAVLVYATASPDDVPSVQAAFGVEHAGQLVEQCLGHIAVGLQKAGVRRLVVAGGETSGAVVQALGVSPLRIGPTIDPGVPWTQAEGRDLLNAIKSGNFGGVDFFAKALAMTQ